MAGWQQVAGSYQAHVAQQKAGPKPSFLEQAVNAVTGVPAGVAHLGGQLVKQVASAPVHLGHGLLTGNFGEAARGLPVAGAAFSIAQHHGGQDLPLSSELGHSAARTGGDIIHPSRFIKASREGNIVGKVLEDAANLSIAAAPAAKLFGAGAAAAEGAGLARTGAALRVGERGAGLVERAAGATAAAPITPYRLAGRGVLDAASKAISENPELLRRYGRYVEPTRRSVSRLVRATQPSKEAGAVEAQAQVASHIRTAEAAAPGNGEALYTAARAHAMGVDEPIRRFVDAQAHNAPVGTLEDARRAVTAHDVEGHTVTPEAANLLARYHAGTLEPPVAKALDELSASMKGNEATRRAGAEAGYGFAKPGAALSTEHAGTAPVTEDLSRLEAKRARLAQSSDSKVARGERTLRRAEGAVKVPEGATRADIERSVLDTARLRQRGGPGAELQPAGEATSQRILARDVGATARPETVMRGVTRTAGAQGEALGVAREADRMTSRGERGPTTTKLTTEDLARAGQARLLRRVQSSAGAPAEALAERVPGESVLAGVESKARRFGSAAEKEAAARSSLKGATSLTEEELGRIQVDPKTVAASARAARDQQVAELRSQAENLEQQLRTMTDATGPIDVRQGVGGTETRGASDQLGRRRLAVTQFGQRLGVFAKAGEGRPVGMDVAGEAARRAGLGDLRPDELASHVLSQVEKIMDLRGQAGRIAKRAPEEHLGQQAMEGLTRAEKFAALQRAGDAFERDSEAGVKGQPGRRSLASDPGATAAYDVLAAQRAQATTGARLGQAGARLGQATTGVFAKGVEQGRTLGAAEGLRTEGGRLASRAEELATRAKATGNLPEEMAQAQARQVGSSFMAGQTAEKRLGAVRTARLALDSATKQRDMALAAADAKINAVRMAPETYPARWRPVMEANARWVDHLKQAATSAPDPQSQAMLARMAAEVPMLPEEMAAAGLDPAHVQFADMRPGARQTAISAGGVGPARMLAAEHERVGSLTPMVPGKVAELEAQQERMRATNETVKLLVSPQKLGPDGAPIFDEVTGDPVGGYSRTAGSVLDERELQNVSDQARAQVRAERIENQPVMIRQRFGEALTEAMHAKGYEPWNPMSDGFVAKPASVTAETPWLPIGTAEIVRKYSAPYDPNLALRGLTRVNRAWKGVILPFSPKWHLGVALHNYVLAAGGMGILPGALTSRMGEAADMIRNGTMPRELGDISLAGEDRAALGKGSREARTALGQKYLDVQAKGFKMNQWIRATQRGAAYLEALDKARLTGIPEEQAVARAVWEANRTFGAFGELSPFERRVVAQVFPFYAWTKHVTQWAGRLAVDHPARMVWALHLGASWGDQDQLPTWLKGGVPIGNYVLPFGFMNPLQATLSGGGTPIDSTNSQLGFQNLASGLSPAITTAVAAGFGRNLDRPGWGLNSADKASVDAYGREKPVPLINRPFEAAGFALNQVPLARTAAALLPSVGIPGGYQGGPVLRFDTGQTRTRKKQPIPADHQRLGTLATQFVPAFPQANDPKQNAAIAVKSRKKAVLKASP